jgi:hypothetical protein
LAKEQILFTWMMCTVPETRTFWATAALWRGPQWTANTTKTPGWCVRQWVRWSPLPPAPHALVSPSLADALQVCGHFMTLCFSLFFFFNFFCVLLLFLCLFLFLLSCGSSNAENLLLVWLTHVYRWGECRWPTLSERLCISQKNSYSTFRLQETCIKKTVIVK